MMAIDGRAPTTNMWRETDITSAKPTVRPDTDQSHNACRRIVGDDDRP